MLHSSKNRAASDQQALREHAIKQVIEAKFVRSLRPVFSRMAKDFKTAYGQAQTIPDQTQYREPLKKIITKYNKKTAEIFSRNIRDDMKKGIDLYEVKADFVEIPEKKKDDVAEKIAVAIALFISTQTEKQTTFILETNRRQMSEAVARARAVAQGGTEIVSHAEIGRQAAQNFKSDAEGRIDTIAAQNVGMTESFSKEAEAQVLNDPESEATVDGEPVAGNLKKQWNAILDNKTRPAHVEADAQYMAEPIDIDESFEVDGEELQYPRDPSGSPENIINCRCSEQIIADTGD